MAEPPLKKSRTDHWNVRSKSELMNNLRVALHCLCTGTSLMNVCPLRITTCDARSAQPFTNATCDVQQLKRLAKHDAGAQELLSDSQMTAEEDQAGEQTHEQPVAAFPIGSIYQDGIATLEKFVREDEPEIPKSDTNARTALDKLLNFMTHSMRTALTKPPETGITDKDWAVQLAQHLLSELAVGSHFKIDAKHQYAGSEDKQREGKEHPRCTCRNKEPLTGEYSDTSFGLADGWKGSVDVLLNNMPVSLTTEEGEEETEDKVNEDDIKDQDQGQSPVSSSKQPDHRNERCVSKTLLSDHLAPTRAQCIVFSFWQNKKLSLKTHTLIPSLVFCADKMKATFYDAVHDVMLETCPLVMFLSDTSILNPNVIVLLWLILNYQVFGSGVTDKMKEYTAGFHDQVGVDYLEKYKNNIESPCRKTHKQSTHEQCTEWAQFATISSTYAAERKLVAIDFVKL